VVNVASNLKQKNLDNLKTMLEEFGLCKERVQEKGECWSRLLYLYERE
jgi:hypothetical protein